MKVRGLDGNYYTLKTTGNCADASDESTKSQYHLMARELLQELFPLEHKLEEVFLPGSGDLRADFLLITRRVMVEVHGEQHYNFVPFFHKNRLAFLQGQNRDRLKRSWCEINSIKLVELPYMETVDEWRTRILSA